MTYRIGLDLGSTAIKIALVGGGEIAWSRLVPTAPGQDGLARDLVGMARREMSLGESQIASVTATGYGQRLASQAGGRVDEITANALGMHRLSAGRCRTIINIGGQDVKVICLDEEGRVVDFKMNDKCAAGTGRFFEQAARILDTPLADFSRLAGEASEPAELNSTCVVFAETEMVSLLAGGAPRESIILGLHRSVARRVGHMLDRRSIRDDVYLDGGPAVNRALVAAVENELMTGVSVLPQPSFTVAYGAALAAADGGGRPAGGGGA
ncbi:MAG: acyl-CoA dehydratase activase [Deltaproteobacteria bacterium]|jgi:predicted CoA-substrate-specific enzyme activase|nr:acyl-CoA dehydratase activase [Deltaproteobacteria bacterium]